MGIGSACGSVFLISRQSGTKTCLERTAHIFDGVHLTQETAAFQLCDIHDPMLSAMINSEEDIREVCDVCLSTFCFISIYTVTIA